MKSLTISEIRNQVITGSYSISHEGMKEDGHGWEHYARKLEEMVSKGMFGFKVQTLRDVLLKEICGERENQDLKWGEQNHHPERWLSILVEEVGEASKEICEYNGKKYREEMIQVAAVALSMLECFDRNKYADHTKFNPSLAEAYNRNRPFKDQISEEWKGDDYAHLK
jgi:NTP pyrophosphatase (non-canonical NTP hydrolase)